jgi:hypothetical protein
MSTPATTAPTARPAAFRRLAIPWNTELVFFLLAELALGIMCLTFESVNGASFFEVTKFTAAAYLIARGIAKAGRALDAD